MRGVITKNEIITLIIVSIPPCILFVNGIDGQVFNGWLMAVSAIIGFSVGRKT